MKTHSFNLQGIFDDVPLVNPDRDEAWSVLVDREDVQNLFKRREGFDFPLDHSYDLWCICWAQAWEHGFNAHDPSERLEHLEKAYNLISMMHSEAMNEIVQLQNRLAANNPSLWTRLTNWFKQMWR